MLSRLATAVAAMCIVWTASGQQQSLAPTPPMGWNSWNHFRDKVDDATIAAITPNGLVRGLKDGRTTIRIDVGDQSRSLPVTVNDAAIARVFHFDVRGVGETRLASQHSNVVAG